MKCIHRIPISEAWRGRGCFYFPHIQEEKKGAGKKKKKKRLNLFSDFFDLKRKMDMAKVFLIRLVQKDDAFFLDESGDMRFCHSLDIDLK